MRKTIFSCAFLMSVSAACAVVSVGCSGDDNTDVPDSGGGTDAAKDTSTGHDATADANKPDTGSVDSGGGDDTGTPDTGTPDTSTADTGTPDTGADGGVDAAKDGAADASIPDTGSDTGTPDTGTPDTGTPDTGTVDTGIPDTGIDTGLPDTGVDAGSDASDASAADASDASTTGFDNPVQIDVTTVLNANTVVTTTPLNGAALTSMDKSNWDFMTTSKAKQLNTSYVGLPDDGSFAAVVGTHTAVKLHWNNASYTLNSRVVQDATPFTFPVTPGHYTHLQVYGLSTEGSTTINVVLTYSDSTTSAGTSLSLADWFNTPTADQFILISGVNRIQGGTTVDTQATKPSICGSNVAPDPTKMVTAVTITNTGTGYFVFYGAVAY